MEEAIIHGDQAKTDMTTRERASRAGGKSFSGSANWEEAVKLASEGDPKLGTEIQRESAKIASSIFASMPKPDIAYAVSGQVIDMGKFLNGEPECCLNLEVPDSGNQRILDLVVNGTVNCGQDKEHITNRGIAIATVIKTLESLGVSIRLFITFCCHRDQGEAQTWIKFKDYGEPLKINQLAFALAHPSMARRIVFGIVETAPKSVRDTVGIRMDGGYGACKDMSVWNSVSDLPCQPGYLYMPVLNSQRHFYTLENSRTWAEMIIKEQLKTHS